ncbi:MAG: SUF system NifU family Fe-S cluster assembly protein [Verrucomicrobia bacterium]|nr:SUF system NifU family Fe-S cluster assembly protein [Verrucomicrobiota bacterium]
MFLDDLYQKILLDHYQHPRHFRELTDQEASVVVENPACGDRLRLRFVLEGERITTLEAHCEGCAICTASTSMMAESLTGKTRAEANHKIQGLLDLIETGAGIGDEELGDLKVFEGVQAYPGRKTCATLAWKALKDWLEKGKED